MLNLLCYYLRRRQETCIYISCGLCMCIFDLVNEAALHSQWSGGKYTRINIRKQLNHWFFSDVSIYLLTCFFLAFINDATKMMSILFNLKDYEVLKSLVALLVMSENNWIIHFMQMFHLIWCAFMNNAAKIMSSLVYIYIIVWCVKMVSSIGNRSASLVLD